MAKTGKFQKIEEAQAAVRELLGMDMTVVCVRYDSYEWTTEVVAVTSNGVYWMVKYFDDGMVGYGTMNWDLSFNN